MGIFESVASIAVLAAVIYLGLTILKNVIITILLVVALALVLHYFGYLLPF